MIETQYINLFTEHRQAIDSKSVDVLNKKRDDAFEIFSSLGFPTTRLEDYQYSDVANRFAPDYGFNINRLPVQVDPYQAYKCNLGGLSSHLYFLLNDMFHNQNIPSTNYPKGVFVGSLNDFATQHPAICAKHYGNIAILENNAVAAFNTMFAQDGFVVYIPDNVVLETPIQLMNILTANTDFLVNRRLLIIVGKNAQVKLLSCDHTVTDSKFLATQVTEIYADENSHVELYELEENSDKVTRLASTYVQQERSANCMVNNITLHCGFTRNNYHVKLNGENAEATIAGVVIADKAQHVDNFAFLDHAKPHCQSTQLFKYVLQDHSVGSFCGRILVEKDAQKTMAYQTNNNLCASPDSRMYSKPQLEIYADDVKCSHGLTTGQLDEEALFYLQARGIPKADAKLLLMQAFTGDVINLINIDLLRERLEELVEKRFRGEEARCGDCTVCK
ncbi:MAG: Fe-S cluster assembly protein SufD [Bacteroidota bacterium]|jgi:Fe-S cluster assembly protein SufD